MSRLSDLYKAMETLRNEGLSLNEDLEKQVNELEEKIIQKEILPIVTETIAPALTQVQRELVLVVDYVPGSPIKVSLSRKRNITDVLTDAVEIKPDQTVNHKEIGPQNSKKSDIAPKTHLRTTLPNGHVIEMPKAKDTMIEVVKYIGAERIRSLGMKCCKVPLISNSRDAKYGTAQHDVGNGWLLITHSSTIDKKKILDKIAKSLNIKLKVEVID